jgi:hypothetical protein
MAIQLINHDPQYWRDLAKQKRETAERMHSTDARASFMSAAADELEEPDSLGG